MPLTPEITLTATFNDYSGNGIGSSSAPAYLRIALCNFGQSLPRVAGTAMIVKVASWPQDIAYTGTALTVLLWGNDVIYPANTCYCISVLDANKNVIQSGLYQFSGNTTIDLSSAAQIVPPASSLAGQMQRYTLVASGSGSSIVLPYVPAPGMPVLVFRGLLLSVDASDYTISGNTITISYVNGDVINVIYWT